jgi:flagella basal body P-ring formation protein FlgA
MLDFQRYSSRLMLLALVLGCSTSLFWLFCFGRSLMDFRIAVPERAFRGDHYVVATRNIAEGTLLTERDLEVVQLKGLRMYREGYSAMTDVIGRQVVHPIPQGQPVIPYQVGNRVVKKSQ